MGIFDDIVKKAEATLNGLKQQYRLGGEGNPWPQANGGFLDPNLLSPSEEFNQTEKIKRYFSKRFHLLFHYSNILFLNNPVKTSKM
jgi:hypothetical protein